MAGLPPARLKRHLHASVEQEPCDPANVIEIMIRDYCARNGVAIKNSASAG